MHPLTPDLSGLPMDELQKKYNELLKRLSISSRVGSGSAIGQLYMLIDDYKSEIDRRNQKILNDAGQKNSNFKNIIDIQ